MVERSVALFDIDRTAYEGYLLFAIVQQQAEDGLISDEAQEKVDALKKAYEDGSLDYESMVEGVLNKWAEGLEGKSVEEVEDHTEKYLRGQGNRFYPYVLGVVDLLKDSHDIHFVTGEPQFVAGKTAEMYGAHGFLSTEFETRDGMFTGKVNSALSHGPHKLKAIRELLASHSREKSFAFGDSEGDIDMLEAVEYAVCIKPTPKLAKIASEKGWFVSNSPNNEVPAYVRSKLA